MALIELNFRSQTIQNHAHVQVVLPDGGLNDELERPYKTLWLLHGANGDCTEWLRQTSLERYAEKYGLAVVLPTSTNGFWMDMAYGSARYFSFLTEELVPTVRYLLPCLSAAREENFAAGASMGGYGAYKWAVNRPEMFSRAGSFAGALDMADIFYQFTQGRQPGGEDFYHAFGSLENMKETENDVLWTAEQQLKRGVELPKLWAMIGRQDFGYRQNLNARDRLQAMGADLTFLEGEGAHSYDVWDRYLEPFFQWLLREEEK